jgi:hypothetical protein
LFADAGNEGVDDLRGEADWLFDAHRQTITPNDSQCPELQLGFYMVAPADAAAAASSSCRRFLANTGIMLF